MDKISVEDRKRNMSAIRGKNTKPEMLVRRMLHSLGYRYRIHQKHLPGRPDIVFTRRKKVILIHGCFWHQHTACREGRIPSSRTDYWKEKLDRNVTRDSANKIKLLSQGWEVLVLWECEIERGNGLQEKIVSFLDST